MLFRDKFGIKNIRKANAGDDIVDASGNGLAGNIVGELSGIFCDKRRQKNHEAIIKDAVHIPNAGYNLLSLTKRLEQEWALGGDSNVIWITKGNAKIAFDIKIKTPKGAISAMYFKCKETTSEEMLALGTDKKILLHTNLLQY
eukprot:7751076-Ditylum_brightwellii.AAC.1